MVAPPFHSRSACLGGQGWAKAERTCFSRCPAARNLARCLLLVTVLGTEGDERHKPSEGFALPPNLKGAL